MPQIVYTNGKPLERDRWRRWRQLRRRRLVRRPAEAKDGNSWHSLRERLVSEVADL